MARLTRAPACRDLGFALGPRINAGGRVGKADIGVRLLTATDPEEARRLAAELDHLNEERRAIKSIVLKQHEAQTCDRADAPPIIVAGHGWHPGVVGIVSSRLKERFDRPAIVIALDEESFGKGSGRSISGVDLCAAALAAKDDGLLAVGGGHAMTAGLTMPPGGLEPLRAYCAGRLARDIERSRAGRALLIDSLCALRAVSAGLCEALDAGCPYGAGWPSPRLVSGPVRLRKFGVVGNGHVRCLACRDDGASFKWIAFRQADTLSGRRYSPPEPTSASGWRGRSCATTGTAASAARCTSTTPPSLDRVGPCP